MEEIEEIMDDDLGYSEDPSTFKLLMAKVLCKLMCNEMDRIVKRDNCEHESFYIDIEDNSYGGTKEPCVTLYRKTEEFKKLRKERGLAFGESRTSYDDSNTLVCRRKLYDIVESVSKEYYGGTYNAGINFGSNHSVMTDIAFKMNTILNDMADTNEHLDVILYMAHSSYGGVIDIIYVQ